MDLSVPPDQQTMTDDSSDNNGSRDMANGNGEVSEDSDREDMQNGADDEGIS